MLGFCHLLWHVLSLSVARIVNYFVNLHGSWRAPPKNRLNISAGPPESGAIPIGNCFPPQTFFGRHSRINPAGISILEPLSRRTLQYWANSRARNLKQQIARLRFFAVRVETGTLEPYRAAPAPACVLVVGIRSGVIRNVPEVLLTLTSAP